MIYFIETVGMVKIGHSTNPKRRLAMLATGCPTHCSLIGVTNGGPEEEKALHERFAHLRVRGEWFNLFPEITSFLSENAIPLEEPSAAPNIDHPVAHYLSAVGMSVHDFCVKVGISRTHLYRIMGGQNTTTRRLKSISAATDWTVSVSELLKAYEHVRSQDPAA
jgi:hypothetical protein